MKYRILLGMAFISILLTRCSKADAPPRIDVTGQWAFMNQSSQSFPFPSVLTDATPMSVSSWSVANDSIHVKFENNGWYSFSNFRLPPENGTYKIIRDSMLVFKPDTSAFIKFCYSTPNFYASPVTIPGPSISSNYHFTSDTIYFKKSGDNIVFAAVWLNLASAPIQPGMDTIILTRANSTFRKLQ